LSKQNKPLRDDVYNLVDNPDATIDQKLDMSLRLVIQISAGLADLAASFKKSDDVMCTFASKVELQRAGPQEGGLE